MPIIVITFTSQTSTTHRPRLTEELHHMSLPKLSVYYGLEDQQAPLVEKTAQSIPKVTVPVGEILPLLADADRSERTWLTDFVDEEMTISADLYEVLLAYQDIRRGSA